jgi:hypothetical protein
MIIWPAALDSTVEAKSAATLLAADCSLKLLQEGAHYGNGGGQQRVSLRLHRGIAADRFTVML